MALTDDQKNYLAGFVLGQDVARTVKGLAPLSGSGGPNSATVRLGDASLDETRMDIPAYGAADAATGPALPEAAAYDAQRRIVGTGDALSKEEKAKQEKNPLDLWDELRKHAAEGRYPRGTDVFLWKFQGLFFVAPAQTSFMCRMRLPGGAISAMQLRAIGDLADLHAGGYAHVTTRANLQLREIQAADGVAVLDTLTGIGIVPRGSGGDNIRNVTASPLAGVDPSEMIDTLPLAREWHNYILHNRDLYGLPRKFNVAFDGGGAISALEDTNDIGFTAVRVPESEATDDVPAGVHFRLTLGGITGHKDFARDTGVLCRPSECTEVAAAIVRVFVDSGDRTNRAKARLKYVLDDWGFDKFLAAVEDKLGRKLVRFDLARCEQRPPADRLAHLGFHPQRQDGLYYCGVVLPVGKLTSDQLRGLADISMKHGRGDIRLTVWQNLILTDIDASELEVVREKIEALGLSTDAANVRAGLVACTGNFGCKFAASDTKTHAMAIADYLEPRVTLDRPLNIHLTGCHHSCAQHYIGDIGLLGCQAEDSEGEFVEGYHLHIGGGYGPDDDGQGSEIGRLLAESVPFEAVPPMIESLLQRYLDARDGDEPFAAWARRQSIDELAAALGTAAAAA